jgi:hypothetical protein
MDREERMFYRMLAMEDRDRREMVRQQGAEELTILYYGAERRVVERMPLRPPQRN